MKEELDSQLSAMFDDQLPEAECQLLARRLSRDDELKARWRRYAVIGAAVRAERGVRLDTNLAAHVSAALSSEPVMSGTAVAEGGPRGKSTFQWWQPIAGGAIAAGVAALSVMWIRGQAPVGGQVQVAQNSAPVTVAAQAPTDRAVPESYVVPPTVEGRTTIMPTAELANYVVAHSEFSTPVTRRSLLSALVASESGTPGAANESDNANVVEGPSENVDEAK